ncbi:MAG: transposase [Rubrobacteraceae bacterium]
MRTLLGTMIRVLAPLAPLFFKRVWEHVQVLVAGAILVPGKRTVSSALRAVGLDQEQRFHRYHRVLSRAKWSNTEASRVLTEWAFQLLLLVRRWHPGRQIVAVGDGRYASLKLLDRCRRLSEPITFIARLRLDAALYEPAPPRCSGQIGRPRLKGERLPNLSIFAEDPDTESQRSSSATSG